MFAVWKALKSVLYNSKAVQSADNSLSCSLPLNRRGMEQILTGS